ncbi:helix-turn-helix transcriptional regulator [Maritalea porphyrae]|uniref:Helix-turn-helix domain-containing protein n=1 Tax=Maritalea porphyrae TaxID=880732 RepID=A0ABQ5UN49_9HYPH|nr:helix-turn-helix domain-containing protein [Maritalea porphyrae]GLQ16713.1 hypothetical protein GCM10007879_09620 [Maritalea porphyrae]
MSTILKEVRATVQKCGDVLLNTQQAAAYCGLSASRLEKFRVYGGGPGFYRLGGRVFYRLSKLDEWIEVNFHPSPDRSLH